MSGSDVYFATSYLMCRYIYLAHLLVDFLLPVHILNKKQQADATLICELGSGVASVLKFLENLKDGEPGESEQEFWIRFDETKMIYVVAAQVITLKWVAGPLLRVRTHIGVQQNLKADRKELLSAFIKEFKTYYPKDPWQVFDILSLPEGNMGTYGIKEITSLYEKYSKETPVLAVQDEEDAKESKKALLTVEKVLLPIGAKAKIIAGVVKTLSCPHLCLEWKIARKNLREFKPRLKKHDGLSQLSESMVEQKTKPKRKKAEDKEAFTQADAYCEFLSGEHDTLYPTLCQLIKIMLVIPANTACCERVFSLMKHIKNEKRNRLGDEKLNNLIMINQHKNLSDLNKVVSAWVRQEKVKKIKS
jgi:hypothetical protein